MFLPINKLEAGMTLSRDVLSARAAVLVRTGTALSPEVLRRLAAWGIEAVHVSEINEEELRERHSSRSDSEIMREAEEAVNRRLAHVQNAGLTVPLIREIAIAWTATRMLKGEYPARHAPPSFSQRGPAAGCARRDLTTFLMQAGNPPSLPEIYYQLTPLIEKPDTSVGEVAHLILQDQSLTSRILKLANSAFFGHSAEVATIEVAVQLIGLREIHNLVLATSVIKAFDRVLTDLLDVASFWQHSIACGIASALLAEGRNDAAPERMFIGGLLHEIGLLIMVLNAPEESCLILERCESEGEIASKVEREVFGFDHAMLGAELAWLWKLPRTLIDTIECHHSPPDSSPTTADTFLVHYADFITSALEFGNSGEVCVSPLKTPDAFETYYPAEGLESFVNEVDQRFCEVVPMFLNSGGKLTS